MPEFSACYFCGTALDAPLAEYPVVPDALQPAADEQRTVVLCPSCRRKLGAVVDAVVSAVDDPPSEESIQQELTGSKDDGATTDDGASTDDPLAVERVSAGEEAAVDEGESTAEEGVALEADGEPATEVESEAGIESEPEAEAASSTEAPSGTETANETDTASGTEAVTDAEPEPKSEVEADDSGTRDEASAGTTTDDEAAAGNGESGDGDSSDGDDEPQLTALEYNKVMRLLQNREFPIDHEEFKVVATNAYEISDDEFDAIIDAAEQRDLIGLEGGQIVES